MHLYQFYITITHCIVLMPGQSEAAPLQHQMEVYEARAKAFGWNALVVDGHDVEALCKAFAVAATTEGQPTCIVAKTFKG